MTNIHRDTYSTMIGNHNMISYVALCQNVRNEKKKKKFIRRLKKRKKFCRANHLVFLYPSLFFLGKRGSRSLRHVGKNGAALWEAT